MFPKPKNIRLKGKKLHELYDAVHARDAGQCVKCGTWVEPGTPPHHRIFKSQSGGDELENLETLCQECHYKEHF